MRIKIVIGVAAFLLTVVVETILLIVGNLSNSVQKKIKEAERLGNCVQGTRVHCTYVSEKDGKWNQILIFTSLYKYVVNGVEYTKSVITNEYEPPFSLTFYWDKNPRKVFSKYDIGTNSFNAVLFLIPLILCLGVIVVLGYINL